MNLLFQYPDIYKTGIAVAAVANQLTYDNIYQERYMGIPQENKEDFVNGSPMTYAKNLREVVDNFFNHKTLHFELSKIEKARRAL